jgi:two-component system CheB/CheR fusion protein
MSKKRSKPSQSPKPAPRLKERPKIEAKNENIQPSNTPKQLFPIVGIGASAGGLEAFTAFLKHLPSNPGMAFVLVQHLDPNQPSQLAALLSKTTSMPVLEVKEDTPLEANHVYVMAPGVCLRITDEHLRIEPRGPSRNLPIDFFLKSLATVKGSTAVGIVLSGTASDGTLGLKAVKAEGGVTFVQEPSSAKFDGMPRSAMAAGVADFVLTPVEIAERLVLLARHPFVARKPARHDDAADDIEFDLNRIFQLLRTFSGNDFTHYKHSTVRRRIQRRMVLNGHEKLSDYVTQLQENPTEVRLLADDLLICVTAFFREPDAFEALARTVFPTILENRSPENPVRVWIAGCATGEETYSIAICLAEVLEASGANVPVQIFATDISEAALDKARAGRYSPSVVAEVSPERLKRFFKKVDGEYQIDKSIREICIFAKQNVVKDPPFRNLDLISCCNVLIYLGPVLQRKALSIFHYALKQDGFLLLGQSESVGALPNSFMSADGMVRLYTKKFSAATIDVHGGSESPALKESAELTPENIRQQFDVQKVAERMLMTHYVPAGVIIDDALNVVHVRGATGPYLQLAPGEPTYNLLRMAREGLIVGLRTSVLKAKQKKAPVSQQVRVKQNGDFKDVNIKVIPLDGVGAETAHHFIVLFEEVKTLAPALEAKTGRPGKSTEGLGSGKVAGARIRRENEQLIQELGATKEYLQSIIEEQEATTEELKSANEEAQASNEELETSREELQSANEELNTVWTCPHLWHNQLRLKIHSKGELSHGVVEKDVYEGVQAGCGAAAGTREFDRRGGAGAGGESQRPAPLAA